jgi:hypothetical protein
MEMRVISFLPPVVGTDDRFNTFRLGSFYVKNLIPEQKVFLLNEKDKLVFGSAIVERVENGPLGELCLFHAHKNHTQLNQDSLDAPARLFALMGKIYGPHIATTTKKACVIYLRRIE